MFNAFETECGYLLNIYVVNNDTLSHCIFYVHIAYIFPHNHLRHENIQLMGKMKASYLIDIKLALTPRQLSVASGELADEIMAAEEKRKRRSYWST